MTYRFSLVGTQATWQCSTNLVIVSELKQGQTFKEFGPWVKRVKQICNKPERLSQRKTPP